MIEVEDKYRVNSHFELPSLNGAGSPVAAVAEPRSTTLTSVYFDTDDLRLAREGVTLRHRSGEGEDGWQLKLPVRGARSGTREELHAPGSASAIPGELTSLVRALVRHAQLQPRATLRTERATYGLLGPDGTLLAELVDDRVDAITAEHKAARFREIEVEDYGGGSGVLDAVGKVLRAAGAVAGEFQPKVVRALGAGATALPDPPPPAKVSAGDPARALVTATLRRHVRALLEEDPEVRLRSEDSVHRMRVNARRLRAALLEFAPLLDDAWSTHVRDELQWLGASLAAGRDAEVVQDGLRAALEALPPEAVLDRAGDKLMALLAGGAKRADAAVGEALDSDRYLTLLDDLVDAALHPRTTDRANEAAGRVAPALFARSWRRLSRRASAAIRSGGDPVALHRTRIAAKNTRYLADALIPLYGAKARRFAESVERIQASLGAHQDAIVAAETLSEAATAPRTGRAAFTFGILYAGRLRAAETARADFIAAWPEVAAARNRRWIER